MAFLGPGPGRPKGVPNKATTQLKDMVLKALDKAGGIDYLVEQAKINPGPFLTLVGKVLPFQVIGDPDRPLEHVMRVECNGLLITQRFGTRPVNSLSHSTNEQSDSQSSLLIDAQERP
jgi:hypothetical protein